MNLHVCPWWLAYTFDHPLRRLVQKPEKILRLYVKKGMTVMDVGCGMGFFSIGMARMIGERGKVFSVDLQQEMLDVMIKRAQKAGVADRIHAHPCDPDRIGIDIPVDFILAFYMVHEVPDRVEFLNQLRSCLTDSGRLLIAEPKFHVSKKQFREMLDLTRMAGLQRVEDPDILWSRSVVLMKE